MRVRFLARSFKVGHPRWTPGGEGPAEPVQRKLARLGSCGLGTITNAEQGAGNESSVIHEASGVERMALVGARHYIRPEMFFPWASATTTPGRFWCGPASHSGAELPQIETSVVCVG